MMIAMLLLLLAEPVMLPGTLDLANKKDPISGKKVAAFHADWKGVRVWFETGKNAGAFRKEPTKYLKPLGIKWDKTAKVVSLENTKCPVTGKPVVRKQYADKNGLRVYTCCSQCKEKLGKATLWKDPTKLAKKLGYKWVPGVIDLKNEKCPISEGQLYPEAPIWVDIEGIRVRVCCDKCVSKAKKDPAGTFRLLGVDPEKLKEKLKAKK